MSTDPAATKPCQNCQTPIPENAGYCFHCGQKYVGGKIPLSDLFRELADAFLNLDSKIIHTLKDIWIPGRLTLNYFAGRRRAYVHPARLFLALAIVFLALLNWRVLYKAEEGLEQLSRGLLTTAWKDQAHDEVHAKIDSLRNLRPQSPPWQAALDTLDHSLGGLKRDSTGIGLWDWTEEGIQPKMVNIDNRDMATLPIDSLLQRYEVKGWTKRRFVRQIIQVMRHGGDFWQFAIGQMTWMLLVLMPAVALWMKMLYVRRKRYFIEHLYWSFHIQSFIFLASIIVMLAGPEQEWLWSTVVIGSMAYIFEAQRRYYGQNWIKTFIKFMLLGFFYFIVIWIFIALTLLIAGLVYA